MFGRIQGPPLALYYFTKGSRIEKPRALVTPTSANGQGLHACMHASENARLSKGSSSDPNPNPKGFQKATLN
jgi:hypothetical protein